MHQLLGGKYISPFWSFWLVALERLQAKNCLVPPVTKELRAGYVPISRNGTADALIPDVALLLVSDLIYTGKIEAQEVVVALIQPASPLRSFLCQSEGL